MSHFQNTSINNDLFHKNCSLNFNIYSIYKCIFYWTKSSYSSHSIGRKCVQSDAKKQPNIGHIHLMKFNDSHIARWKHLFFSVLQWNEYHYDYLEQKHTFIYTFYLFSINDHIFQFQIKVCKENKSHFESLAGI